MEIVAPEPPLSDGVVTLRPWDAGDLDGLIAALDNDPEIERWLDAIPQPYRAGDAHAWLAHTRAAWRDSSGAPFAVVDAEGGELLGGIGVRWIDAVNRVGEVGYWAKRGARGRGLTARALGLVTDWVLGPVGCKRLVLRADVANVGSQRVAARAGFVREGVERSARFSPRHGRRVDFVVYSRLPDDA